MNITDLVAGDSDAIEQVAVLLVDYWPNQAAAWPDLESAYVEVEDSLGEGRVSRIAVDDDGNVLGWGAAAQQYDFAWELHPLVVARGAQGRGIGRALVADLERRIAAEGALTMFTGADDIAEQTSVGGRDLFPGVLRHAEALRTSRRHPAGFFRHLGYEVVGIIPDANGRGRPDIWLAKRVAPWSIEPDEA